MLYIKLFLYLYFSIFVPDKKPIKMYVGIPTIIVNIRMRIFISFVGQYSLSKLTVLIVLFVIRE